MYTIVKSGFRWAFQCQTHRTGTLNSQDKEIHVLKITTCSIKTSIKMGLVIKLLFEDYDPLIYEMHFGM